MSLGSIPTHKKRSSWRLNDNLLHDSVCTQDIIQTIRNFVKDHTHDDANPLTKWEALKCVLRGKFIQHSSRLKCIRTADISRLLTTIASLEESNKWTPDPTVQLVLINARRYLLRIFAERSMMARDKGRFAHYSLANKCGRHLANTVQLRQARKPIPFINSSTKGKILINVSNQTLTPFPPLVFPLSLLLLSLYNMPISGYV